jgi:uncharacterized protein YegL
MTDTSDLDRIEEGRFTEGQVLMPFYIICDVSGSMGTNNAIGDLNGALRDLVADICNNPVAADIAMLSIISFSDSGKVEVPLSRPEDISVPTLRPLGGTSFAAGLETYHTAFEADRARLKSAGSKVYRPCVFFLSDGYPNSGDDYKGTFQRLLAWDSTSNTGNKAFPYVVSYGFGDAASQPQHIQALAYPDFGPKRGQWFLSRSNDIHSMLKSIIDAIGKTVLSSGLSAAAGNPQIITIQPAKESDMQFGEAGDFC